MLRAGVDCCRPRPARNGECDAAICPNAPDLRSHPLRRHVAAGRRAAQHHGRGGRGDPSLLDRASRFKGSLVTLSFSFKRDGTLIGPPQPTDISVAGDEEAKKRFVDAAIAAVESCVPLEFAPALAAGIGGQVFTMQFATQDTQAVTPAN